MLITKTLYKQVKLETKLTCIQSVQQPFYMAMNKKMLEEAGVANLVKEGWTTDDFEKVFESA